MTTDAITQSIPHLPRHRGGDEPDILGMRLAHRVMLGDLHRMTALARDVAAGRTRADRRRATAMSRYITLMADSIHHHHKAEDDVLWPVIVDRAGAHIDLGPLTDDHSVLDPKLDRLRTAAAALAAAPDSEDAAADLALLLGQLTDLLDEHIAEEEEQVFPVILEYLSVDDWTDVETRIRKNGHKLGFELPRILDHITPEELARVRAGAGPVILILAKVVRVPYRRLERQVFGA